MLKIAINGSGISSGSGIPYQHSVAPLSPDIDSPPSNWTAGDWRTNSDPASEATLAGWYCTVDGTPGTWIPVYYGANKDAYYVVTRATNAPANAVNLGALTDGLLRITVSGGIATISVDNSILPRVANIAALTAIDTSSFVSTRMYECEVASVGDTFRYIPIGGKGTWSAGTTYNLDDYVVYSGLSYRCRTSTSIGNTPPTPPAQSTTNWSLVYDIIAASTGTGVWSRQLVGDKSFFKSVVLSTTAKSPEGIYINGTTGNDENTGLSSGSPLLTFLEASRRLVGISSSSTLNIYITGNTPQIFDFSTIKISSVRLIGTPTVIASTTLNGAADTTFGVTAATGYVTSASLDFHTNGYVSTTTRSAFIRRDNGDGTFTYAAIQRTDSGTPLRAKITKQCKLTPGNASGWSFEHEPSTGFFTSGQSVDIVSFPSISSIVSPPGTTVNAYLLDASQATGPVNFRMCGFTSSFANTTSLGGVQLLGGIIQCSSTISVTGSLVQLLSVGIGCSSNSSGSLNIRFCDLQNMLYLTVDDASISLANCSMRLTASVFVNQSNYAISATQSSIFFDSSAFCCDNSVVKIILCDRGTKCTGFENNVLPYVSPSSSTPITILGMAHGDLALSQIPAWSTGGNCGIA